MQEKYNYHGIYRIDVGPLAFTGWVNALGEFHPSIGSQMDFKLIAWTRKFKKFVGWA